MAGFFGKTVFITGGSSGIGLATAKIFAAEGANIAILARSPEKLAAAKATLESLTPLTDQWITVLQADVADHASLEEAVNRYLEQYDIPDVLINSAGVARPGECIHLETDLYRWMMEINFLGTVNVTKCFLPGMIRRRSGHIVNVSSVAGFMGVYGYSAYGATKFAIKGFSDALRLELQPHNIHVSIVFPPDTQTPQLEEEQPYKPPVLVASEEGIPIMDAQSVAKCILRGIARKRYIITPGFYSTLYFLLTGLTSGGLIYPIMDWVFADARNKVRRNPGKYIKTDKI